MKVKLICDIRENFQKNMIDDTMNFNDHPPLDNILEIQSMVEKCGYPCSVFGGIPELIDANSQNLRFNNCIFLNLTDGLDMNCGRVQAPILLETLGVCYSGANPFQAALIDNKYYTKLAVKDMDILVPDSLLIHPNDIVSEKQIAKIGFPIIIKPNTKGSSIGITQKSVCYDFDSTLNLILEMQKQFDEILIEQFIPGYEITNFIIGNKEKYYINVPVLEEFHGNIIHNNEVMAIEDKAYRTRTFHLCDNILGKDTTERIKKTSQQIKESLKVNDILRIDYRVTESKDIYFLEANTVPRICSKNEAGFICRSSSKPYDFFISCLLKSVIARYKS